MGSAPPSPAPLLEFEALLRRPGGYRLKLHLALPAGVTVLCGPSAAGKSTTLDILAGHLLPDAGRLLLGGRTLLLRVDGRPPQCFVGPAQRRIGYVMQAPGLFPQLDVARNLAYGLFGWPRAAQKARLAELTDALDLGALLRRRPAELSGGERQRVALGRALAPAPQALLLDEPLSAVDLAQRDSLLERLRRLLLPLAIPVLYVTHSAHEERFFATALRPSLRLQAQPDGTIEVGTAGSAE
jgi:molybdate transport system ATP-binding protein